MFDPPESGAYTPRVESSPAGFPRHGDKAGESRVFAGRSRV